MADRVKFPPMGMIHQSLVDRPLADPAAETRKELATLNLAAKIKPGDRVGITGGSRGIRNISLITKEIVSFFKTLGAEPFIFPAMGSHGGAVAEGQIEMLEHYGITEELMGASVLSSMEVEEIGKTKEGLIVYVDSYACRADHIFVVNRIKPHTKFKGHLESGLCKMMTIGLGKQKGADYYHMQALKYGFSEVIEAVATVVLEKMPVLGGLAIIEDGFDQTSILRAIEPDKIIEEERGLLDIAKEYLPKLPFSELDVLIVDQIGKDISGAGMDYNIIGRNRDIMDRWYSTQKIKRIFVRDLTKNTSGNGLGIGMADFTTERLIKKLDLEAMYMNALTASGPENAMLPIYFDSDRKALESCLTTIGPISPAEARIVWIKDTLSLEEVLVSESL
ncbi:MAG TPA: [Fe-S]-binding protein, partial [Firmicutes bacterium]|nr:[Fe-S]-binding protein [Bacillota bacterium]